MQDHGDGDIFQSHLSMLKTAKETKHKQTILLPQKKHVNIHKTIIGTYTYIYIRTIIHIYISSVVTYNKHTHIYILSNIYIYI
jgi:hypothetical protein